MRCLLLVFIFTIIFESQAWSTVPPYTYFERHENVAVTDVYDVGTLTGITEESCALYCLSVADCISAQYTPTENSGTCLLQNYTVDVFTTDDDTDWNVLNLRGDGIDFCRCTVPQGSFSSAQPQFWSVCDDDFNCIDPELVGCHPSYPCDDGNDLTIHDRCLDGICKGFYPQTCNATCEDYCQCVHATDPFSSGATCECPATKTSQLPKKKFSNGDACDDGDVNTIGTTWQDGNCTVTDTTTCRDPLIRQDWRDMTPAAQTRFIEAIWILQTQTDDEQSCDQFVINAATDVRGTDIEAYSRWGCYGEFHFTANDALHGASQFLPAHRIFGYTLAAELRALGTPYQCITIPFWDWTRDGSDNDARAYNISVFVGDQGFGDMVWQDHTCVPDSNKYAWSSWKTSELKNYENCVERRLGKRGVTWATSDEVHNLASSTTYENWTQFNAEINDDIYHSNVHNWVAGEMSEEWSAGDPVFFLHHAQVDRFFAMWQDCHGYDKIVQSELQNYPNAYSMDPDYQMPCQDPDDPQIDKYHSKYCWPWTNQLGDVASARFGYYLDNMGYVYEAEPDMTGGSDALPCPYNWDCVCEDTWDWFVNIDDLEEESPKRTAQNDTADDDGLSVTFHNGSPDSAYAESSHMRSVMMRLLNQNYTIVEVLELLRAYHCQHSVVIENAFIDKDDVDMFMLQAMCQSSTETCWNFCILADLAVCEEGSELNNYCELPSLSYEGYYSDDTDDTTYYTTNTPANAAHTLGGRAVSVLVACIIVLLF